MEKIVAETRCFISKWENPRILVELANLLHICLLRPFACLPGIPHTNSMVLSFIAAIVDETSLLVTPDPVTYTFGFSS